MDHLEGSVDRVAAETAFSGVVRVDRGDGVQLAKAYGLAHRLGVRRPLNLLWAGGSGSRAQAGQEMEASTCANR